MTWLTWDLAPLVGSAAVMAGVLVTVRLLSTERSTLRLSPSEGFDRFRLRGLRPIVEQLVDLAERTIRGRGAHRVNALLEAAGISLRPAEFVLMVASGTVLAALLLLLRAGVPGAIAAAVIVPVGAYAWVGHLRTRRRDTFAEQLPDTLQLLSSTLRAGYGLMHSVEVVGQRAPDPTALEFRRVLVETRLGRPLESALDAMARRIDVQDLHWVVQAIAIHREVGGDLTEILDTVGATVREREEIRGQIRALSAEGRLSGIVLLALPVVLGLGLAVLRPDYLSLLFSHGAGWAMVGIAVVLLIIGGFWVRRLLRLIY